MVAEGSEACASTAQTDPQLFSGTLVPFLLDGFPATNSQPSIPFLRGSLNNWGPWQDGPWQDGPWQDKVITKACRGSLTSCASVLAKDLAHARPRRCCGRVFG